MNKTGQSSIEAIKTAFESLQAKGVKYTQSAIAKETNLSIRTVKRHWERVTDNKSAVENRVTLPSTTSSSRVTGSSFERFRRRVERSPIQVYQCSPDMF